MKVIALAAVATLLAVSPAVAHDVWLTLEGPASQQRVVINYGHPDDRPPASVDKIVDIVAVNGDRTTSLRDGLSIAERNDAIVAVSQPFPDDGHALFAARYDNGFWSKTRNGYVNATRRLAPEASESVWSGKFAKALSGPDAPWLRVLGHVLEIVPLSDPARIAPGGALRLRVMFHGQPLANVDVERGDGVTAVPESQIPRFRTDAEGVATIPMAALGPCLLVVDYRVSPSATPDQADADLFNATLWFVVAEH